MKSPKPYMEGQRDVASTLKMWITGVIMWLLPFRVWGLDSCAVSKVRPTLANEVFYPTGHCKNSPSSPQIRNTDAKNSTETERAHGLAVPVVADRTAIRASIAKEQRKIRQYSRNSGTIPN